MTLHAEADAVAGVLRAKRALDGRAGRGASAGADPTAREFLGRADPILRRLIDTRPNFHPRAWLNELSPLAAVGDGAMVVQFVHAHIARQGAEIRQ